MSENIELIKNGSFSSVRVNSAQNWHVPTDWQVVWDNDSIGELILQSVGAVYGANNALLFSYENSDPEFYDTVYNRIFPPGIYQAIDLTNRDLTNVDHYTFSVDARLENPAYRDQEIDIYIYEGYYNEPFNTYEIHYDATFKSYKVLQTFSVPQNWQTITFDIKASFLSNKIYMIGITPHINVSGVANDNEVKEVSAILDDVSFAIVPKEEVEEEDTNLVKNGSFKNWEAGMPSNWFISKIEDYYGPFNISLSSDYGRENSMVIDFGKDGYYTVLNESEIAPGVYQLLDLSDYSKETDYLRISFNFSARLDNINHTFSTSKTYRAKFFVYEVDENGSPTGGLLSYKCATTVDFDGYNPAKWVDGFCSVDLKPGYYYIGFSPGIDYGVPAAEPLFLVVDDVVGEIEEVEKVISYGQLINGTSFELGGDLSHWTYDSDKLNVEKVLSSPPSGLISTLGDYCVKIYYNDDVLIDDIETLYCGFKQSVTSLADGQALFSFWYSGAFQEAEYKIKVCVYKEEYSGHEGKYVITEPPILEKSLPFTGTDWRRFNAVLYLDYGVHYTVAFYPYDEENSTVGGWVCLDAISLVTYEPTELKHSGTYEDPFTDEDVSFSNYRENGAPIFFPYIVGLNPGKYFIRYNGSYYCTNGAKDELGNFICYYNTMVQSPVDLKGMRYFFPDGKMARNTSFTYNDVPYSAGPDGELSDAYAEILNVWTSFYPEEVILKTSEYKTIEVLFESQVYDIFLEAEIEDTRVASVFNIEGGLSSNRITIRGKSKGKTELRVYYVNRTGLVAETTIPINVIDEAISTEGDVYFAYETNAVTNVSHDTITIDYFILPEYVTNLPLEWTSSDESVATVDMYGNVLGLTADQHCTITATNPYNQQSASCIIYVGSLIPAYEIRTSEETLTLSLNDTKRITAQVLNESLDVIRVVQDVKWESSDPKIATVNKYGFITGIARGSVDITCTSIETPTVSKTITVHVVGTPVEIQDIELDCDSEYFNDFRTIAFDTSWENNYIIVKHRFAPLNANTSDVIWSSSDEELIKVTQSGKVYLNPAYEGEGGSAIITCRCLNKSTIYKQFEVLVNIGVQYEAVITAFDTEFATYVGQTLRIDYGVFYLKMRMLDGVRGDAFIVENTTNTIVGEIDDKGPYINFTANEAGTFTVRIKAENVTRDFIVKVHQENTAPQLIDDLKVIHALQNKSCVLRCKIKDDIDKLDKIDYYIDFGDGNGYEKILDTTNLLDEKHPEQYFFISPEYGLAPDIVYKTKIKAVDQYGLETETNTVDLVIPKSSTDKASLEAAKVNYDDAIDMLIEILNWIVVPAESVIPGATEGDVIPELYKPTFYIQYQVYCYVYDNLREVLDKCVEHINSEIQSSQDEMSTIATSLASDGTSVATYSEGDYTNSNYQNVSDMDYYQNVCIKELANRVLQLEALIQQLINNN